jgi:PAS domain-containing protein
MYMGSSTHRRFIRYGTHVVHHRDDESSVASSTMDARSVQSPSSLRAQHIFHSCATHFDGEHLLALMRENWVSTAISALQEHVLPFCIVDTTKSDIPFVYANNSFCDMLEYRSDEVVGHPFAVVKGHATEAAQWIALQSFLKSSAQTVTRTWVTVHTKQKRRLLDLVAVETVGPYAVMVHFAALAGRGEWTQLEVCGRNFPSFCHTFAARRFNIILFF